MFKKKKVNDIDSNNDTNKNTADKKPSKKFKYWKFLFAGISIAVIIAILCGVFIPKPKQVTAQNYVTTEQYANDNKLPISNYQNDLIIKTQNYNDVLISSSSLSQASIVCLLSSSSKSVYLCEVPTSSIGKMQFQFTIYNGSNGPTYVQIGNGDLISLTKLFPNSIKTNANSKATDASTPTIQQLMNSYKTSNDFSVYNFLKYVYVNALQSPYPSASFNWALFIQVVWLIIMLAIIFSFVYSFAKGGSSFGGGDIFSIGKSQAKIATTNVRFKDVGGIGEEKYELEEIVDFLKRPAKYASMGARIPKGVILYGPPGTGKTLLAKAVAGEAKVPFFETSGSGFEDMLVGVGAKRVRDLFNRAIKVAPAIIFIDEIDSVASKRSNNQIGDSNIANQTLNELLSQMDGFNTKTGVIVIAATNRLDMLDEAILRPGRFDRQIPVNLPDIDERVEILKIHTKNKNISSKVSLEDVARRTPGFSGAQLENVLNEAALLAVRHNSNTISLNDIDEAIDRVIGGPAKKNRKTSFEEKKQISFHEAGHALVGLNVKGSDIVEKITIIPRGKAAGYTLQTPAVQELQIQKKSDLLGLVASTLGGRASEEIVFGEDAISTGASNDLYKATNIVRAMVTQLGMTNLGLTQFVPSEGKENPYRNNYSQKTAESIDQEIANILAERYEFAKDIIKQNRRELELIVESLLILETIDRKQIEYIHTNKKLPVEVVDKILYLIQTNQLDENYLFEPEKEAFLHKDTNNQNNLDKNESQESISDTKNHKTDSLSKDFDDQTNDDNLNNNNDKK